MRSPHPQCTHSQNPAAKTPRRNCTFSIYQNSRCLAQSHRNSNLTDSRSVTSHTRKYQRLYAGSHNYEKEEHKFLVLQEKLVHEHEEKNNEQTTARQFEKLPSVPVFRTVVTFTSGPHLFIFLFLFPFSFLLQSFSLFLLFYFTAFTF